MRDLIYHATQGRVMHGPDCELFRLRMNGWGWRGCWRRRVDIMARIREQAAKHGYRSTALPLAWHTVVGLARWTYTATRRRVGQAISL